ncbi:MAG: enolase C-terminal domain-like protein [Desulfatiglans sp.]|jgi:muconate cycloisomerase|nr:enolase C-terminal domain-like protein [Desulfatiglans sp.]
MIITKLRVFRLTIKFKRLVSHNLYRASETEAFITAIEDESGIVGYGEGTPRTFISGETIETNIRAASTLGEKLVGKEFKAFDGLKSFLEEIGSLDLAQREPSAWCALELSVLDLWAKRKGIPLWQLFTQNPKPGPFVYSAVLPVTNEQAFHELLSMIKEVGQTNVKLKVADRVKGIHRIRLIRKVLGSDINIRVDCNGAFSSDEALSFLEEAESYSISAVEQPVPKEDFKGLREVSKYAQTPVIADESLRTMEDAKKLIENRCCKGFSVKLSKCGGLFNSLGLLEFARKNRVFCQISCHIGESAILSAAGRSLVALSHDCRYLEGSFSTHLLEEDLSVDDISFGRKGYAPLLTGVGLGILVDQAKLGKWSKEVSVIV